MRTELERQTANLTRAENFTKLFKMDGVRACGVAGGNAMANYHNAGTGWGFTVEFITLPDDSDHIKAWTEFVSRETPATVGHVAEQFHKIFGGA